jgi:hypothetical protein
LGILFDHIIKIRYMLGQDTRHLGPFGSGASVPALLMIHALLYRITTLTLNGRFALVILGSKRPQGERRVIDAPE